MDVDDQLRAEVVAESRIREILLKLQDATGRRVEWVRVDTRELGDCSVEISTTSTNPKRER